MAYYLIDYNSFPGTYSGFSSNLYVDTDTNGTVKWQIRIMRDSGSLLPFNNFTDATNGPRANYSIGPNSASSAAWTYDFRNAGGSGNNPVSRTIFSGSFTTTASTYSYSVTTNGKTPLGFAPNFSGSGSTNYTPPQATVPSINGLLLTQANTALSNAGLSGQNNGFITTTNINLNNTVLNQSPSAGTTVSPGSTVSFNVYTYVETRTVYFNGNGGSSSASSRTGTSDNSFNVTTPTAARTDFTFNGWYSQSSGGIFVIGANQSWNIPSQYNEATLFAQWTANAPTFSDSSITTTALLAKNISTNADRTVTASPVSSYSIVYSGSGLNPTSWLTINSSGQLSGVPPQIGTYTFLIRATNAGINTDTSTITLTVLPPGDRMTGSDTSTSLSIAKRYDGTNWIDLSVMKRFDGTNWIDISHT
jgi:uncharacterized repeat protein (TIGR02543 family)